MDKSLLSRFKGSLVGAVVGDCIGAHFEMQSPEAVSYLVDYITKLLKEPSPGESESRNIYTDDTAMARSVASSLIERESMDVTDMAKRFTDEYFSSPERGYGASVGTVFKKLREQKCANPFEPASQQFGGSGSYGNGGAMRISPAALFAYHSEPQQLNNLVKDISRITHSNPDAINGAILQAYAVHLALRTPSVKELKVDDFVKHLQDHMCPEPQQVDEADKDSKIRYCDKLDTIVQYLQQTKDVTVQEIEEHLGTDVSALGSVPAAVYSFLRASRPIPGISYENAFKRTIIYAISLGGDTDTIASMAGAIAGAYYGIEEVPQDWQDICEGVDDGLTYADQFYKLQEKRKAADRAADGANAAVFKDD